jgi:transcriptional regulator with XRE-family HTH domain
MAQIRNQALLNSIGKKIKALRESKGLTQEEVFNDTSIHVGRIENGSADIRISTIEAICKYFKISLSEFFKDIK